MQVYLALLENGKLLPLVEEFYTLQGEGFHTGKAAYFIRIGGCDIGCSWCDAKFTWNPKHFPPVSVEKIVQNVIQSSANAVVVTGGEPGLYPLDYLCEALKKRNIETYVETSGAYGLTGQWDWICLSPKVQQPPEEEMFQRANELKVIITSPDDFQWAEENARKVNEQCMLFLQPEWSVSSKIMQHIVDYTLKHPQWRVSLQSHKYMRIP